MDEKEESIDSTLIKIRVTRTSKLKSIQVKGTYAEQALFTHSALSGSGEYSCNSKGSIRMDGGKKQKNIPNLAFECILWISLSLCHEPLFLFKSAPGSENSICRMDPSYSTFIFFWACIQLSQNRSVGLILLFLFLQYHNEHLDEVSWCISESPNCAFLK